MKQMAIGLLFALLVALGMVGHAATVQVDDGDTLAVKKNVNWNS